MIDQKTSQNRQIYETPSPAIDNAISTHFDALFFKINE